jgi:release factor glutamine methyltransferase
VILKQTLNDAREVLTAYNKEDVSLNCELMLRHVLKMTRVELFLDLNKELTPNQEQNFWHLIQRYLNGEPAAYITGHREFYGIDFYVDKQVFIPRPESELLVEKALTLYQEFNITTIAEVGTGCGAIAISLSLNLPEAIIYATDISSSALRIARANYRDQEQVGIIHFIQGDMLAPITNPVDLIIANLPYIKTADIAATNYEPTVALDGGYDGLGKIRELCFQLNNKLSPEGHLLLEFGQGQTKSLVDFLTNLFPKAEIEIELDMQGIDRMVCLSLPLDS